MKETRNIGDSVEFLFEETPYQGHISDVFELETDNRCNIYEVTTEMGMFLLDENLNPIY